MKAQKKNCCDNNNSDTNLKNLLYKYNIKRQLSQIEATIRSFEYELRQRN